MKASSVRKLATDRTVLELEKAIEAIVEREADEHGIDGEDLGEKLTHCMLAMRIRSRVDAGEDAGAAFRAEMAAVRDILKND